jgi:SET domain-containing protein 6
MASDLDLVDWFTAHNGTFDRSALAFAQIDSLGRGAFALRDLQVQPHLFFFSRFCWKHGQLNPLQPQPGHTLFTLPRHLTLSTRTSSLPSLIGEADWKKHGLHVGWAGLILCLMWEAAQGTSSKWSTYLGMDVCILSMVGHLLNRRSKRHSRSPLTRRCFGVPEILNSCEAQPS